MVCDNISFTPDCFLCQTGMTQWHIHLLYAFLAKASTPHQHGFLKGRSCSTNLLAVLDSWTEAMNPGNPMDVIYSDFAKAFDSVPYERLLLKLHGYEIKSWILEWIHQFLQGRRQCVRVNVYIEVWLGYRHQQYSPRQCPGSFLFVVYINDLPEVVRSCVEMFADDTKIYSSLKSENDVMTL